MRRMAETTATAIWRRTAVRLYVLPAVTAGSDYQLLPTALATARSFGIRFMKFS